MHFNKLFHRADYHIQCQRRILERMKYVVRIVSCIEIEFFSLSLAHSPGAHKTHGAHALWCRYCVAHTSANGTALMGGAHRVNAPKMNGKFPLCHRVRAHVQCQRLTAAVWSTLSWNSTREWNETYIFRTPAEITRYLCAHAWQLYFGDLNKFN